MLIYCGIFVFLSTIHTHKVGLILNSGNPSIIAAIKDVAEFTLSNLDNSSEVTLITKEYSLTYLSILSTICSFLDENVTALISASSSTITAVEAEVASQFHIPYIATVATDPYLRTADRDYLMFLSPSDKYQSQAIFDILKYFNWLEFSILASADDYGINGLVYLQYLATRDSNFEIKDVQHFDVGMLSMQTDVTKELQLIKESLARVIVLNCGGEYAKEIFRDAKTMGLMDEGFVWIVTDSITGQPENLAYNGSFPSYYRGIIGTVPAYGKDTNRYNEFRDQYITEYGGSSSNLMMSSILVSDGIKVIHESISVLENTGWDSIPSVSCSSTDTWNGGKTILTSITDTSFIGISGNITFNTDGVSVTTEYDIMNFQVDAFAKVGTWNNVTSLDLAPENMIYLGGGTKTPYGFSNTLTGFHLRIGIVPEPPIAYHKHDQESCRYNTTSPDCWYGWNPDIIKKLSGDLSFTYEYVQPEDQKYGGYDEVTGWNGMIKDILERKTDLTIALSINTERSKFIDFTLSFFEDQASFIVFTKSTKSAGNMFFFLLPFSYGVFVSIFGIIAVIAFFVTLLSKLSPYGKYGRKIHAQQTCCCSGCLAKREWKAKHGCRFVDTKEFDCSVDKIEDEDSIDDMSFYNSVWVVSTGLVQQGTDTLPHAPSGRFLLFFWWLFVMILVSMYTANLTAHLTLERSSISIATITDLLDQDEYSWGIIIDRNLESMMKSHDNEEYVALVDRGTKLTSLTDGKEKVENGGFVFIDESSVLSFNFKDNCTAVQTNTGKFSNEWAFGLQTNSPYASVINSMFLQYREEGWFTDIWDQWYKSEGSCATAIGSDMRFDLPILSGLFAIFAMGILCSFILVILETLHAAYSDSTCVPNGRFWVCLSGRLNLKKKEIQQEWLGVNKGRQTPHLFNGTNNSVVAMNNVVEDA